MATARRLYNLGAEEEGERTELMMALSGVLEKHMVGRDYRFLWGSMASVLRGYIQRRDGRV